MRFCHVFQWVFFEELLVNEFTICLSNIYLAYYKFSQKDQSPNQFAYHFLFKQLLWLNKPIFMWDVRNTINKCD